MTPHATATPRPTPVTPCARVVTLRVDDLSTLAARGVWMSTAQRGAVDAVRIELDPDQWDALRLERPGLNVHLGRLIEERLEPILNPLHRSRTAVHAQVEAGEPARCFITWGAGKTKVGVIRISEHAEAQGAA